MTDGEALRSLLHYAQNEAQSQSELEVARHLAAAIAALNASKAAKGAQSVSLERLSSMPGGGLVH